MKDTRMLPGAPRALRSPYAPALTGAQAHMARAFHRSFPHTRPRR